MSALYLIDRHGSPLSSALILDVQETPTTPVLSGRFVVKVADGIPVQNPTNLGDLLTKKGQGYLLFYVGFTRIAYDDLLDTSGLNMATTVGLVGGSTGAGTSRSNPVLGPGGVLESSIVVLTGSAPSHAVITWDTFNYVETDSATSLYVRQYNELSSTSSNVKCEVSFDGGTSYNSTTDSAVLTIPAGQQGTNFIVRLTNVTSSRLGIGGWTLVY